MDIVFIQNINQLRESRGDPYALLILDALHALAEDFLNDHGQIFPGLSVRHFIQVHEHGDKRSLAVAGHEGDQLVLNGLDTGFDFFLQTAFGDLADDFLIHGFAGFLPFGDDFTDNLLTGNINEGSQMRQGEGLAAVLVGGNLRYDLGGNIAGGKEGMGLLNEGLADDRTVLKHILQIDQIAVVFSLGKVIRIVEMNDSFFMGFDNIFRKEKSFCQVLGNFPGHVIALGGIDDRILIGVFLLDFFIGKVDQGEDSVIGGIALAGDFSLVAVADIFLCDLVAAHLHDASFHHILDVLHVAGMGISGDFLGNRIGDGLDLVAAQLMDQFHFLVGLFDGMDDFGDIKSHFCAVSFDYICPDLNRILFCLFHLEHLRESV